MIQNYKVKTIVTSTGERLPLLLGRDGLPIFEPTVFSLAEVRSRNRAVNQRSIVSTNQRRIFSTLLLR